MMHICITFDYELFFGENNGTYDEVLFKPTYSLINALHKKGVSATFFADVCSIPVAKKYHQNKYVEGFCKQLQYMKKYGQDVQLHIHPHWFDSRYNGAQWEFSNRGYRLHEFENYGEISKIIAEGIHCIKESLLSVDRKYECIAYRAGGFSLQPHNVIVKALYDNGIRVDSSVAPQLYANSDANFYDYRHCIEKLNWHISDSDVWWEDSTSGRYLLEIPIATVDKSIIPFVLRRIFSPNSIKLNLESKRGSYINSCTYQENKLKSYYNYVMGYNAISMDAYTAEFLYTQTKRLYAKNMYENQVVAIIGHPKLVTDKYIENLCRYIDFINNDSRFSFISIYDAYQLKEKVNAT